MTVSNIAIHSKTYVDEKNSRELNRKTNWRGHTVCRYGGGDKLHRLGYVFLALPFIGIGLGVTSAYLVGGISFKAAFLSVGVAAALPIGLIACIVTWMFWTNPREPTQRAFRES